MTRHLHTRIAALLFACLLAAPAWSQGVDVSGFRQDGTLPVEISADSLRVDQAVGTAVFDGNVLVGQGTLKMQADRVEVTYAEAADGTRSGISSIHATGNITLTNGEEAAEAQEAVYQVSTGRIDMTGDVLLTQGQNALSGEALEIDLASGQARMTGRVRTVIQPQAAE